MSTLASSVKLIMSSVLDDIAYLHPFAATLLDNRKVAMPSFNSFDDLLFHGGKQYNAYLSDGVLGDSGDGHFACKLYGCLYTHE